MDELEELRRKIDRIDAEILGLLSERGRIALEVGAAKKDKNMAYHFPDREREVLEQLYRLNQGPFSNKAIASIYREILAASLSLQKEEEDSHAVSYLGPQATYTHQAAVKFFGFSLSYLQEDTISGVFESVFKGKTRYGVVPIENSNEGVVNYTLDMFIDYNLSIYSEIMLNISHCLLSLTGKKEDIKKVYSHPQAIGQCRVFIEKHLPPGVPVIETLSTARAAERASKEEDGAAIASEIAAKVYQLQVVEAKIEDKSDNYTRFLVIAREYPHRSGKDKTSILFSIKDRVGALYSVLEHFDRQDINLTNIQSRPSKRRPWEYIFFIDLQGHIEDEPVQSALKKVKADCLFFKVLGSYPAASSLLE